MQKLIMFNQVTLDGYFTDAHSDMSWAHKARQDAEWQAYVAGNASGGGTLLFGRVTYDMMAAFWPTPQALAQMPDVANGMNSMPKIVFSRTLSTVSWSNTTLVKDDLVGTVRRMKQEDGPGVAILGSGTIVSQLAAAGLIDEYQLVINPLALGAGRTLFEGIGRQLPLKLTGSRTFKNGNVVLTYEPPA
jgi:dihydrofolate reductase